MDRLNFDLTDLRADRQDRAEEQARELYARLFIREQRRRAAEWKREFGDKFPVPNTGPAIHQVVVQQLAELAAQNQ